MSIGLKTGEGKAKSKRHTAKGENGNQRGEKWASTDAFRLPLFPLTSVNKKKKEMMIKKRKKESRDNHPWIFKRSIHVNHDGF